MSDQPVVGAVVEDVEGLYPPKRRAWVPLDYRALHAVLNLPEGMRVVGVESDIDPVRVRVLVESDRLPEVEPNAESPMVSPYVVHGESFPMIDWAQTMSDWEVEV